MKYIQEKYKILITLILKNIIYLSWYSYAIIAPIFIKDTITDSAILYLIISFLVIYFIRETAKHFYKKIAHQSYYEFKHNVEMYYYKRMNKLKMEQIEQIDKEYLSDKILEVSYNATRIICTTGEYLIPALIGILLILLKLFTINFVIASIVLVLVVITLLVRHKTISNSPIPKHSNYNDLLKDFILNFKSIKKLNIFDFTYTKLDNYRDNDLLVIKDINEASDIKFNNGIFIILTIILLGLFFTIEGTTTTLGLMIYFIFIILKLQDLLYQISPTIINFQETKKNKILLESYFKDIEELVYEPTFKKVSVIDGKVSYKSGVTIKIPNFTLNKGDQISILGKAGQGKSTILNVLSGASTLNEGKILFDNKEKNSVVNTIHITKETAMFKMSLRDNICLGQNIKDEDLLKYINEIGLSSWFNTLLYGLDTILDDKEIKLSNSQKQRINILRTMVTNKDIIFLDEPSHDLDIETEKKVADMIKKYLKKKTIIIVTHRPTLTTICKKHFFIKDHTLLESEPLL